MSGIAVLVWHCHLHWHVPRWPHPRATPKRSTVPERRPRTRRRARTSSPALQHTTVKPVPEKIGHDLFRSSRRVVDRHTISESEANVLSPIESHLELRHNIPVRHRPGAQAPIAEELDHWAP